jgi:hypothetical protein
VPAAPRTLVGAGRLTDQAVGVGAFAGTCRRPSALTLSVSPSWKQRLTGRIGDDSDARSWSGVAPPSATVLLGGNPLAAKS